jgi:hypothetical protein
VVGYGDGDIRITMLGSPGAGKTCYMLGMYNFMQIGVRGFTMSMPDMDASQLFEDRWQTLIEGGDDRWPVPNAAGHEEYTFELNYGFIPMMRVRWIDYRGGILSLTSADPDVPALRGYVVQSSCLFLCIPGEALKDGLTHAGAQTSRIAKMNELIKSAVVQAGANANNPFPIALVITKFDLCRAAGRTREAIMDDLRTYLSSAFAPGAPVLAAVIPVTLGNDLARDSKNGEIEVLNMHLPFAFAIWAQYQKLKRQNDISQAATRGALDEAQRRGFASINSVGDFLDLFLDPGKNSRAIQSRQNEIRQLEMQSATIDTNMRLLMAELRDTPIYRGGETVDI